jgi:hypothetical protein
MPSTSYQNLYEGLLTLDPITGEVPESRMENAWQVRDMVTRAIRYDMTTRDWKRARIKGLVDGNPPYSHEKLVAAGRGDECNVNWRMSKYFLGQAKDMLYDVISEAQTFATVVLDEAKILEEIRGDDPYTSASPEQVSEWGRTTTEEFDRLQRGDPDWDSTVQQSQGQCVLYGCGPMIFEDSLDWRPWSFEARALLVPEWAKSNTNRWEWAALIVEYSPDKLFQHIMNPEIARKSGWDVPATRQAIMGAHPLTRTGVMYQNWSWHQDLLKNGTLFYTDQSKVIRAAHFYFREFPEGNEESGRITECIVDLDGLESKGTGESGSIPFLFRKVRKYESWSQVMHPMYWGHDVNGYHHSVTGLGVEMFSPLEYMNRLFCRNADDAMAPKLHFRPTTASERERMSIAQVGRYAIIPSGLEMIQQHMQPFLQDGIAMSREVQQLVSSNLSQFRSGAAQKQGGNPVTARQIDYEASEQAKMGKTQLNRIYEQYDWVYAEKYRRATNPNLTAAVRGGKEALDFRDRCKRRGVPLKCLSAIQSVKATRVVGQGSSFLRQQALEFLLGLVPMLPESGRTNLIKQVIASRAGQTKVAEFFPDPTEDVSAAAQQAEATLQVAAMKIGIPPVPVPTQNPLIFAGVFLQAGESAAQSVQQGGDPAEAAAFLDIIIPAVAHHLSRMEQDKTRADAVKEMGAKLKELGAASDSIKEHLAQQQQEQQAQQAQLAQMAGGMDGETQVGMAKVAAKHQVDMSKLQGGMVLKAHKQDVDLAMAQHRQAVDTAMAAQRHRATILLDDASTAADITRKNAEAKAKAARPAANGKK